MLNYGERKSRTDYCEEIQINFSKKLNIWAKRDGHKGPSIWTDRVIVKGIVNTSNSEIAFEMKKTPKN